jgi:hypothetical protein
MKIITEHPTIPFKHLKKVPSFIDQDDMKAITDIRILEIKSLHEWREFMIERSAPTREGYLASMKESEWSGTETWREYINLLDTGDQDLIAKIKIDTNAQVKELKKQYKDVLTSYKFDVTGEFFDIGLVLSGVPETWLTPVVNKVELVKLDIYFNAAFNAVQDKDTIVKNAAKLIAIIRILEDHDIQVSLKAVSTTRRCMRNHNTLMTIMEVKNYNEPLNYSKVSTVLSPSYFRRGHFKLMEEIGVTNSGYGTPIIHKNFIALNDNDSLSKFEKEVFK